MTIVVAGIVILDSPVEGILGGLIGILRGSRGVAGGVRGGCSGGNGEEGGNGKEDLKIERVIKVDVNVKQKTKTFFKLKQIEKEGWEHFNFKIQNNVIFYKKLFRFFKSRQEHSRSSTKFLNQNLRPIIQGVHELHILMI